jgi:hypothetical protein
MSSHSNQPEKMAGFFVIEFRTPAVASNPAIEF